jgi:hypothetical protein
MQVDAMQAPANRAQLLLNIRILVTPFQRQITGPNMANLLVAHRASLVKVEPPVIQHARRVGRARDCGADLVGEAAAFKDSHGPSGAPQGDRRREPRDAGADDGRMG